MYQVRWSAVIAGIVQVEYTAVLLMLEVVWRTRGFQQRRFGMRGIGSCAGMEAWGAVLKGGRIQDTPVRFVRHVLRSC